MIPTSEVKLDEGTSYNVITGSCAAECTLDAKTAMAKDLPI